MMTKTSLLNVAQKTLMVLGAAYLLNCGSSVLAPAKADGPTYTEHFGTCGNATAKGVGDPDWARIEVPGATQSQLERAIVRGRETADAKGETFIEGQHSIGRPLSAVRLGDYFDESIWVRCDAGTTIEWAAYVPRQ